MNEIKQFKLSNGEEVVCDVVEWPDPDDDSPDIVVRNCFKILIGGTSPGADGIRYYTFKPWMVYQDEPDMYQVINGNHIVGEANPPAKLMEQYIRMTKLEEMDTSEIEEKLNEYISHLKSAMTDEDENIDSKVVPFKPKIH
jgi:hypothetical protein